MYRSLITAGCLACIAISAKAHEFWIDPVAAQVQPGDQIVADLRVGQAFKGSSYSYIPENFRRFDVAFAGGIGPVEGTVGDRPAVNIAAPGAGLVVLIHETSDYKIVWDTFEDFESFVEHKDAAWTLEAHRERGLPDAPIGEVYSRYAKALVAVGDGAGEDIETGMETEIVALENPYTGEMSDGIDVLVLYQGAPRAEEQIEVFEKAGDDSVTVFTLKTDAEGRATVPVKPGYRYMLDSVVLREPAPDLAAGRDVVWESLWANLTFAVP
jgi:uncharacterized GH25 family protein